MKIAKNDLFVELPLNWILYINSRNSPIFGFYTLKCPKKNQPVYRNFFTFMLLIMLYLKVFFDFSKYESLKGSKSIVFSQLSGSSLRALYFSHVISADHVRDRVNVSQGPPLCSTRHGNKVSQPILLVTIW